MKWFYRAGLQRTEVHIGNIVQCWLPKGRKGGYLYGNREPKDTEIEACWQRYVRPWLKREGFVVEEDEPVGEEPRIIVPVGAPATRWFLKGGERYAGTFNFVERFNK